MIKEIVKKIIPSFILEKLFGKSKKNIQKELDSIRVISCDPTNLHSYLDVDLSVIFENNEILDAWNQWQHQLNSVNIPDLTGGVNPGDRKAIFFLMKYFKPKSVLEVGTHIGSSTVNIASALTQNETANEPKSFLRTLDIRDVNSITEKPWLKFGSSFSPLEMLEKFQLESHVEFLVGSSLDYLKETSDTYDFIFLDGDHSAKTVYQEIPLALTKLNKGGVILLHDYFPNGKPLWSNKSLIYGPFLAGKRLMNEGAQIVILPLGNLPWKTKLNSNSTSLALCLRK